jgi:hypothetical protein
LRPADYDALPRFVYVEERTRAAARRVLGPAAALAAGTLVLGVFGSRRLRRFPVVG